MSQPRNTETIVRQRYAAGAKERADKLCCPVDYDAEYLKVIPREVIERDYGCGDPSRYVSEGETVLDLGSGTGKICFIAAQIVGPNGKVIGVDMTDEMPHQTSTGRERFCRCCCLKLRAQSRRTQVQGNALQRNISRFEKRRSRGYLGHRERRRSAGRNAERSGALERLHFRRAH